jgi:myo-inositol-1(or 4)-monophosphatase
VVLDVPADDLYAGVVGHGARCNGTAIRVSKVRSAAKAILATGFPVQRDFSSAALQEFLASVQRYKKIRMLGSAALSLAYVAAGRADVYAEDGVMLWDVAAGLALVHAAGGVVEYAPSPRHAWARDVVCGASAELWRGGPATPANTGGAK